MNEEEKPPAIIDTRLSGASVYSHIGGLSLALMQLITTEEFHDPFDVEKRFLEKHLKGDIIYNDGILRRRDVDIVHSYLGNSNYLSQSVKEILPGASLMANALKHILNIASQGPVPLIFIVCETDPETYVNDIGALFRWSGYIVNSRTVHLASAYTDNFRPQNTYYVLVACLFKLKGAINFAKKDVDSKDAHYLDERVTDLKMTMSSDFIERCSAIRWDIPPFIGFKLWKIVMEDPLFAWDVRKKTYGAIDYVGYAYKNAPTPAIISRDGNFPLVNIDHPLYKGTSIDPALYESLWGFPVDWTLSQDESSSSETSSSGPSKDCASTFCKTQ